MGFPCESISGSAPRVGVAETLRLKKILNGAKKRCHATPIVRFAAITINQVIEMMILSAATITIHRSKVAISRFSKAFTAGLVRAKSQGFPE